MGKGTKACLLLLIFCAGLSLVLYPIVNGAMLERAAEKAADGFIASIQQPSPEQKDETSSKPPEVEASPTPVPYMELYAAMKAYNQKIYAEHQEGLCDPWAYEAASIDLSAHGVDGVIAVLSISGIELEMPVYLGANYDNMAAGAAVLGQTSLPIGGSDTNCVIAGHRGWNGAPYFMNLDKLQRGDAVQLTTLWETLNYTVSEVKVINPNAVDEILIQPGRELLTLLTCDPPNTGGRYRLLVICDRIMEV